MCLDTLSPTGGTFVRDFGNVRRVRGIQKEELGN